MIAAVIVGLLACAALAFVAQPIIAGPRREPDDVSRALQEADERKRAALLAILDIEEERDVGKQSVTDFEVLRAQYERQALTALHEVDNLTVEEEGSDELENEIARMRAEITCPNCGAVRTGTVCSRCGAYS
jgi:hypothetical protein